MAKKKITNLLGQSHFWIKESMWEGAKIKPRGQEVAALLRQVCFFFKLWNISSFVAISSTYFIYLYWNAVDLQCCVSLRYKVIQLCFKILTVQLLHSLNMFSINAVPFCLVLVMMKLVHKLLWHGRSKTRHAYFFFFRFFSIIGFYKTWNILPCAMQ